MLRVCVFNYVVVLCEWLFVCIAVCVCMCVRPSYAAVDGGDENFLKGLNVPVVLDVKVGCQVVLLKNLAPEVGLVNGSRGVVFDFKCADGDADADTVDPSALYPAVRFETGAGTVFVCFLACVL